MFLSRAGWQETIKWLYSITRQLISITWSTMDLNAKLLNCCKIELGKMLVQSRVAWSKQSKSDVWKLTTDISQNYIAKAFLLASVIFDIKCKWSSVCMMGLIRRWTLCLLIKNMLEIALSLNTGQIQTKYFVFKGFKIQFVISDVKQIILSRNIIIVLIMLKSG